jgi:D-serine deaminase-like pyridoxal phosphate-dependent protein
MVPPRALADVASDLQHLPTPALLVDERRLQENLAAMADRVSALGVELWPHVKTHKSTRLAARQREAGAAGVTVATVHEAEVLAAAGSGPLLLAQPPVGGWRTGRLLAVARRCLVRVALDSPPVAIELDRACREAGVEFDVLWEVDCGLGRLGTPPGAPTARAVRELIAEATHLRFAGLMTYPGHAYRAEGPEGARAAADDEQRALERTIAELGGLGIETPVRSVGSTPTSSFLHRQPAATQARPGNYVFYDATQVALGVVPPDRCSLSVLGTVLGRPDPHRAVLDCGSKALAAERMSPRTADLGLVPDLPGVRVARLYEEHAVLVSRPPLDVAVGDRLRVIPNHACTAANLHGEMLLVRDGEVIETWPLDARGWGSAADRS